jgi:tellurite resistance protein TehA-like permease
MQRAKRFAIIVVAVVLALFVLGLILATIFHVLLDVVYISLMVLAVLLILAVLFQIYWIIMLVRTITTVRDEMKPLIASVQETVGVVKDTAKTAGNTVSTIGATTQLAQEFALKPGVRATAAIVATQQMIRVFLGGGLTKKRAETRRREQMAAAAARGEE